MVLNEFSKIFKELPNMSAMKSLQSMKELRREKAHFWPEKVSYYIFEPLFFYILKSLPQWS